MGTSLQPPSQGSKEAFWSSPLCVQIAGLSPARDGPSREENSFHFLMMTGMMVVMKMTVVMELWPLPGILSARGGFS